MERWQLNKGIIKMSNYDLFGDLVKNRSLHNKFIIPPFTVLNSRDGFWQARKRAWRALGIKGEKGREDIGCNGFNSFSNRVDESGKKIASCGDQVTVFDPVLCELIYKWFCPHGGMILDPFAGGSVRGIVAALLGFKYWGCDLSQKQITENINQGQIICNKNKPTWVCGDSIDNVSKAPISDFIFSCPPYGDLEKYSNNPRDLSAMDYHAFIAAYNRIIMRAVKKLKVNRFACFVVGDFRDKKGFYRNFVSETISAFKTQKLELYNEAILVQCVGSGSLRANNQFSSSRKMVKMHQNILIFIKGDPKKATEEITRRKNGQK